MESQLKAEAENEIVETLAVILEGNDINPQKEGRRGSGESFDNMIEGLGTARDKQCDAIEKMRIGTAGLEDVILVFEDCDGQETPGNYAACTGLSVGKQQSLNSIQEAEHEAMETERRKRDEVSL